ncbi:monocarboxylate transporter 13 [Chiloscyllium plagiosum]|uniref:monocarboxylate transporter 13 n=1 Tax=Chiloscyllium plagiosum TaxID=36176 RepID=UPI001CB7DE35|nr:monocarboxylate transporter 13 [Chiloscyllium plagiosum]XP_043539309.1 monocarboxylate transporter 13 [Chiloscyllium plagiosum]XP_043539310.1 monocarboxylate transporter 13 [Chiloscyllium plagiosum]XP_043539311.1 monocarboxylate transporter 13 [Chiloscyllium plagiosum]XP_043539312.1 monocarboxylate transporter 13 [Chiloscyllium plagiosum]XP_043539313.1 monocarboxylate transporter 13 [Chiloscyllium plagiosum]XP_043539314.1 monocarboxylate transporter 13 [Chiloscyllium plagiosum]XP_04353931
MAIRIPDEVPDGGWGWVIVLSAFLMSALVFGVIRSFGVFFVAFVEYFSEASSTVSWITSTAIAIQQFSSPIASALSNYFGARSVVMLGGFLSSLGLVLACLATNLIHLYLSIGLLSGFGWALVFTPSVAAVSRYFNKRRTLAMGMAFTGVGIGSFVFSPLFQYLIDEYMWQGALLIIAGMMLNLMVCGALIRPLTLKEDLVRAMAPGEDSLCCQGARNVIFDLLDLSLLRHWPFLTLVLSVTLINAGYFVPYVHFVAHAQSIGFDEYQAAFLMSVAGVMDLIGRLLSGWFSDLRKLRLVHILILWTMLTGLSLLAIPLGRTYPVLMLIGMAYGFCAGALTPVVFSLLPEIVGIGRIYGALGLLQMLESVGGLLGAPISGWLRDATGNYTASFVVAGTFLLLSSLVLIGIPGALSCSCLPPARHSQTKNTKEEEEEEECKSMADSNGSGLEAQCVPIEPSSIACRNTVVA